MPDADTGPDDPLWFKDAVIYELHVRAFGDSDGDGIGDFDGLTDRLDYLQQLGVTALWLLPFYPSPLRDDGYDIADYGGINPVYGNLRSFKRFLNEAHRRGLRVITELVLNHTSDQHPWFQRSRRAPAGSRWRDFYVWSDTPERYPEVRVIFEDYEGSNWTLGPGRRRLLLAPLLLAPARPQLRQPRGPRRHAARRRQVARPGRRRRAPRRGAVPVRARRHQLREPPRDPRVPQGAAGPRRHQLPGPHAAGRGQPVARGRGGLLRRRRRVPHGVPLPAHAAPVHGVADGGPLPGHRHPPADPGHPRRTASGRSSCATTTS